MNRSATALACVRALAAQTEPPALVVVADNVSTDDTAESLLALRELPFRFILHRMAENRGNAGGVEEASLGLIDIRSHSASRKMVPAVSIVIVFPLWRHISARGTTASNSIGSPPVSTM
jgi:GT2 family glycosyltransferase